MTSATTTPTNISVSVVGIVTVTVTVTVVVVVAIIVVGVVLGSAIAIVAATAAFIRVCLHIFIFMIAAPLCRVIVDWSTSPPSQTIPVAPLNLYLIISTILHAIADLYNQRNGYEH